MNLQFLLPEVPGLGIWQIDTSSTNSIKNINSAAYLIKRIHGHISMIPLLLTIEPIEAPDPQGIKRKINVLNLRINRTIIEMAETIKTPLLVAAELPIADDEVPDMVIPQVQEEKVTPPVVVPPGMDEKKGKPKTDKAPPTSKKKEPPPPPDPEATQDEKKAIIVALKAKGITDQQQIRDFFVSGTGKKGGWLHSDMVKLQNSLKAPSKEEVDAQADAFLKELGLT
jgi:outer membrane biosynthesis protein TonB